MRKLVFTLLLTAILLTACNAQNLVANTRPFGTPIPTLPLATPVAAFQGSAPTTGACTIRAVDLIGAWVEAGSPETDAFDFTSVDGAACQGTFAGDVLPLFTQSNLWFRGAISCVACHGPDLNVSYAQLNLASAAELRAGSRRLGEVKDVLGDGKWEESKMYEVLVTTRFMPLGRPVDMPEKGPLVKAGTLK